jgi:cysteine desulfurase family protein (TIGR01976 family)
MTDRIPLPVRRRYAGRHGRPREHAGSRGPVRAATLDVGTVRARFSALQRRLAFFDGPGGTQCPDSVIDAVADYLRTSNANLGGAFETSARTDEIVERAHERGADFLGCQPGEVAFGPSMTGLNFLLTRALARTLRPGDEVVVTQLDHDANVAPWLELQHDLGIVVHVAGVTDDLELDLDDLTSRLSERTKVVAFPAAANSVGTAPDVTRVVELAHSVGALAWVDAVHHAPHGPIDASAWDADVVICSPYKFFGPHLGLAYGRMELLESWRPYKVRPAPDEPAGHRFELGTLPHELLAGFVAAVDYIDTLGWDPIRAHEQALGERFLAALPPSVHLYGPPTMEGRVPTFCFRVPGRTPREVSTFLGARDIAVWDGNYYAVEVFRHLGLDDGAVRAGFVHYNTVEEVDRLLDAIRELDG